MPDKIYPQAINGLYRNIKNKAAILLLALFFAAPWIRWARLHDGLDQGIMIDLANRKIYLFSIIIWPQEMYYITAILITAAVGLFFFTSLFGRLWCGYTCPHTVFVDLFRKVEFWFQGDRNARIKLDLSPYHAEKILKKLATHVCWILISFSFALGVISYFNDVPNLINSIIRFNLSSNVALWLLMLTCSTYLFAGFARERVCLYMCPYGRFQSVMVDNNTFTVMYNAWRGEPRKGGIISETEGDCINCNKCFLVCPMGIDIRNGMQMGCIGCGLCVDACNSVMDVIGKPRDLISYNNVTNFKKKVSKIVNPFSIISVKTIIFGAALMISSFSILYMLINKSDVEVSVTRADGPLVTRTFDGRLRNAYTLLILNKKQDPESFSVSIDGLSNPELKLQGQKELIIRLDSEEEKSQKLFVEVDDKSFPSGDIPFYIVLENQDSNEKRRIKMSFIIR
jgi:cytochrome c oxidase accessory protein FixG